MKFLYPFIAFLLFAWTLSDAEAGAIQDPVVGIVIEAAGGAPLAGANISIRELGVGGVTGPDGRFRLPEVPAGVHTLVVRADGYRTASRTFDHPGSGVLQIELGSLQILSEEVVVTSSPLGRGTRYQPAQILDRRTLHRQMDASLGETLEGSPGISMRSFGPAPSRPVIRGLDGERVLLLENGERMGDFSATSADHAVALDPLAIDRVEIVRGPASLLYGSSAMGGVINLFSLDQPREWSPGAAGSATLNAATVNRMAAGMLRGGYGSDRWAVAGSAMLRSAGDLRTPAGVLPETWINSYRIGGGFGYRGDRSETGFALTSMQNDYGIPDELDDLDEFLEIRSERHSFQSVSVLDLQGDLFNSMELRLQANYNRLDDIEIEVEQDGSLEEDLEKRLENLGAGGTLLLRHRPVGPFDGALGVNFQAREIRISGDEILAPDARELSGALFLYEELPVSESFSLNGGVRLELHDIRVSENAQFGPAELASVEGRSDAILSGSLGMNLRPSEEWEIGLQFARAFRTPSLEELYSDAPHSHAGAYEIGDPNLPNELALGSDLFARYRGDRIELSAAVYVNRIDNFIIYMPTGITDIPSGLPIFRYTARDAILTGFELQGVIRITQAWFAGFGADYVRGSQRIDGGSVPLASMPPMRTRLSIGYERGNLRVESGLRLVSRQDRVASAEPVTDGYTLLGMNASWRFGDGLSLSVRLENLLDETYRDHLTRVRDRNFPMPGRNFQSVIRWDF